ncbi:MAG: hypothetical protein QW184_00780 [Nanopusillaceae archaeon]
MNAKIENVKKEQNSKAIVEKIKLLAKQLEAEKKDKEEKRRVRELTKELIEIIKEFSNSREYIIELIKLVNIIEETHEKLEKTYLKLTEELTEENEKIREIAEILEEILENLEREVLYDYRLVIRDRRYIIAMNGSGDFLGMDADGNFVFWTEGRSPSRSFVLSEEITVNELRYLLDTLVPA